MIFSIHFFLVVRSNLKCLPTPRCSVSNDEGCTQPISSDPIINLSSWSSLPNISPRKDLHGPESLATVHKFDGSNTPIKKRRGEEYTLKSKNQPLKTKNKRDSNTAQSHYKVHSDRFGMVHEYVGMKCLLLSILVFRGAG